MGANATTSVPVYASGEVLTAANLNITNSGIPVFATTVTRDAAFGGTGEKTLAQGQFCYLESTGKLQAELGLSPLVLLMHAHIFRLAALALVLLVRAQVVLHRLRLLVAQFRLLGAPQLTLPQCCLILTARQVTQIAVMARLCTA